MRIYQRTTIERPAAEVWPHVIRPEAFKRWNTKIDSMDATGEFRLGQPFTTQYRWRGKAIQCASVATEIEPGRVLELRHTVPVGVGLRPDMEIRERVTVRPRGRRTVVSKVVSITNHGIPWFFLPLIWFVTRFGSPTEPDPLKRLCEGERA
jgi:uncharacterized protein YndB with AHSA1/START domain